MTIAGSDSGGGAGLQADLKTFGALGVFGTSVVTAVTAQNTAEVLGVRTVDPEMVDLQIQALLEDMPISAVKTGMLASAENVAVVARRAAEAQLPNLVVDPVLVSSTGRRLLDEAGLRSYLELLLPNALLVTPNVREAAILAGLDPEEQRGVDEMAAIAERLVAVGARAVLVKGGHIRSSRSPDVLITREEGSATTTTIFDGLRVDSANDHGTGCTLSAAAAAFLARGRPLARAVEDAKSFVTCALRGGANWTLGKGHGPLDHFGWDDEGRAAEQ